MKGTLIGICFCLLFGWNLPGQNKTQASRILEPGAVVVQAGTNFGFTEGCSPTADGRVFFTDQPHDKIYVWDENKGISLFKTGCERANGTYFDRSGNLLACADLHNKLVKFTPTGSMIDVWVKGFDHHHLNGPNDLWIDKKGGIYFTDPYYVRDYWENGHRKELDVEGVYYLNPERRLVRVIDDLIQPNGIVGTPDGKYLYVADIGGKTIWRYTIGDDGSPGSKRAFAPNGSDGMTLDNRGDLYLCWGKVLVYDANGHKIEEITLPESPSNICFGGKDKRTLFITARTSVYVVRTRVRGVE
jgi:gluconolactonase